MKRDKFEELLHDKLARTEVTPPADMWARLEARLPEVRRELAFGEGTDTPAGAGDLPAPRIRRPLRRKMSWAYVAASAAVAGVMIFSLGNLREAEMMAEGDKEDIPNEVILPVVEPELPVEDTTDGDVSPSDTPRPRNLYTLATSSPGTALPAGRSETDNITDTELTSSAITEGGTDIVHETVQHGQDSAPASSPARRPAGNKEQQTSGSNPQEGFAEWMARAIAEENKSSRRSGVLRNASLYAVNSTGLTGSGNVTGRVKLQKSSLIVTETTDYPSEETAGTSYSGKNTDKSPKHDLPLGFGASINIGLSRNLSIETGLTYTLMRSKGETTLGDITRDGAQNIIRQKLHYLGIPVKIKYDFLQTRFVDLYASGGFTVEKLLSGNRTSTDNYYDNGSLLRSDRISEKIKVGSLQTSVGANVGAQFNIDKKFGLYVEPGIGYFFENSNQPESYRTEHPFNFTIKAGFRINL